MTYPDPLAVGVMIAYCGWDPTTPVTNQTVLLDGAKSQGSPLLFLPSLYVTAVTAVTVTDRYNTATDLTVGPGGDVNWSENGTLIYQKYGCWPQGHRDVAVTYSGGYDGPPDDLAAALASVGKRVGGPLLGASSAKMGTAAVAFGQQFAAGGLLMVETMVFDKYRLPRAS